MCASRGGSTPSELADHYARSLAVYYAPVDEDFGMVPFEAFLSERPVLTTADAGGPLEVVADRRTGLVTAPDAEAVAEACRWLAAHREEARAWGRAGRAAAERVTWDAAARPPAGSRGVKVAYFSPLPPERSGIADYSALLLPALARRVEVVVARRGRTRAGRNADVALYHLGNDPEAHGWIVEALRARPGVVVLHDWVLHHLVAGLTLARRDVGTYLEAMERDGGLVGRLLGLGVVDGCIPPLWEDRPERFPLAGFVLDQTPTGRDRPLPLRGGTGAGRRLPRARVADPASGVAAAGRRARRPRARPGGRLPRQPQPRQAHPRAADGIRAAPGTVPDARLLLAGAASDRLDLDARLRARARASAVMREPYADEARLWALLARLDVCVSLRSPTMGETSGVAVRALSAGTPLVVSDAGWFAELPDDVAVKVAPDAGETERLAAALELLLTRDDVRRSLGEAGRAYARTEHDVERVADLYVAALEEAAGGPAVVGSVGARDRRAAAEVGIAPGSDEADELATRLRETGLA